MFLLRSISDYEYKLGSEFSDLKNLLQLEQHVSWAGSRQGRLDLEQMLETLIPPPAEVMQQCSGWHHWVIHFWIIIQNNYQIISAWDILFDAFWM